MNPKVAHLLVKLYPQPWRERYGAEFEALLLTGRGDIRTCANVLWSAMHEYVAPTRRGTMNQSLKPSQFQLWSTRAPWAIFGFAPILLLATAYFVACLVLWSGWRIFLPGTDSPFVPISGFPMVYFGAGRMLYFGAPILIGWSVAIGAARQNIKASWPVSGFLLIALISTAAHVQAVHPVAGGAGQVTMVLTLGRSLREISFQLLHALTAFSITALPYVIWRFKRARTFPA